MPPPTSSSPRGIVSALSGSTSLRAQVEEKLREAMVAGELRPGEIYSAPALAEQLGVSATPVREAMMELGREGFVEPLRHRGYRVVEMSPEALADVTEVRLMLEVPAVGRIAPLAVEADLSGLRELADELVSAAEAGELRRFIAVDTTFHLTLLEILGNRVLVEQVRGLRRRTRLYGLRDLAQSGALMPTAREHHELLDRLADGDGPGAEGVMRRHLDHVRGVWAGEVED